jgi:hypothetical protein
MKKSIILSAILFSGLAFNSAKAQVSIHVGLNIPARPVYVPAPEPVYDDNFDDSDDYYYLPEVEAYYSIPLNRYFYMDGSRWISAAYLPGAYRNYDWRSARRFEIRGRRPYMNHNVYRGRWGGNDNRNWNRFNNNYAGRNNNGYNGGYRDRGNWRYNQPNRNDDNHGRGNWANNQPSRDNWGGRDRGNQPNRNDDNHGGRGNWGDRQQGQPQQPNRNDDNRGGGGNWGNNQPQRGNNGFNQPNRNDDNRGGRGNWGDRQQGQPQQPNRNDDNRGRGNWGGGRERGNQGGGQIADNRPNTRSGFFRPRL